MNFRRICTGLVAAATIALVAPVTASATVPAPAPPAGTDPAADPATEADPTSPQVVESWTLTPAGEGADAGSRPNLSYVLDAGGTVTDAVTVYNLGNVPLTFRVYPADAFNGDDGEFAVVAGDTAPEDVGTWLTLDQENVSVAPGKQTTIPFTLKVPRDASPGDHVGAVVASSPTQGTGDHGEMVTVDRRTGTRLYVRVGGELVPELAVTNLETDYHHAVNSFSGDATVTFRVENRGNIRMTGSPKVSVGGPFGMFASSITMPEISELLPGEHVDLTAELHGVPALLLDSTEVSIVPEGDGADGAAAGTASDTTFAPPLVALLVLLALVFVLLAMRSRRRRLAPTPTPQVQRVVERELQPQ